MTQPAAPPSDDRDWTYVITDGCAECGFVPRPATATAETLRAAIAPWRDVLARPGVATRPEPLVWSPLEYGCHVRDVCRKFDERVRLMLDRDDPGFANWDQDAAAIQGQYHRQDPELVAIEFAEAAQSFADLLDTIAGEQWERTGRRSNGSFFTVGTLAVYFSHDIKHHLHDVGVERS